jgi:hypothetical protein
MVILVMVGGNSVGDVGVDMINVKVTGGGSDKVARVVLVVCGRRSFDGGVGDVGVDMVNLMGK